MADETLLGIADELFALPVSEFTSRRDALAREHKGDKELAAAIKALRKPSLAAWVVNLFVRREPEQLEQMLAVGVALREAQANLDGEELRALTRQRRQLTAAMTTQARGLAGQLDVKVTPSVAEQVEATLTAALVDESAAAAVRSGLLVAPLAATGVDSVDAASAVALPSALGFSASPVAATRPDLHVVPDPDGAASAAEAAARAALDDAEVALTRAAEEHTKASEEVAELEAAVMEVQAQIDELKRRLTKLEARAEELDDELADAEDVRAEAERGLREATSARDAAAKKLSRLVE